MAAESQLHSIHVLSRLPQGQLGAVHAVAMQSLAMPRLMNLLRRQKQRREWQVAEGPDLVSLHTSAFSAALPVQDTLR